MAIGGHAERCHAKETRRQRAKEFNIAQQAPGGLGPDERTEPLYWKRWMSSYRAARPKSNLVLGHGLELGGGGGGGRQSLHKTGGRQ